MWLAVLCSIILFYHQVKASVVNEQTCGTFSNSKFHGHSCLLAVVGANVGYGTAKSSCNHFPNGHLAYVLTEKTRDAIYQLLSGIGGAQPWYAVGLEQLDLTNEPDGGWAWTHNDGSIWMVPDKRLLLWTTTHGDPDNTANAEHLGYVLNTADGLYDGGNNPVTTDYLCEYEQKHMHYILSETDKAGNNGTTFSDIHTADLLTCAESCGKQLVCRAFSYSKSNGNCILHMTTSTGVTALPPITKLGYEMYDSSY